MVMVMVTCDRSSFSSPSTACDRRCSLAEATSCWRVTVMVLESNAYGVGE
jgi:hypothetical protein